MTAQIFSVIDLSFGDSGKGAHVDYLCRNHPVHTVVRFNGGSQAAHNVITPENEHHCFNTFGSGTLAGNSDTYLTSDFLVDVRRLMNEAYHLADLGVVNSHPLNRIYIHEDAPIVCPWHIGANRVKEILRDDRHGSCGLGIGETAYDLFSYGDHVPLMRDLRNPDILLAKLLESFENKRIEFKPLVDQLTDEQRAKVVVADYLTDKRWVEYFHNYLLSVSSSLNIVDDSFFAERLERDGVIVFEGAQGVLLDEDYGFHPYTTWSRTTTFNIKKILDKYGATNPIHNYGLIRAYTTRHGAGPFPSEQQVPEHCYVDHNVNNDWQANFRVGALDIGLIRYALDVINLAIEWNDRFQIHSLVVSCFDKLIGQSHIPIFNTDARFMIPKDITDIYLREEKTQSLSEQSGFNFVYNAYDEMININEIVPFTNWLSRVLRSIPISIVSISPTAEGRLVVSNLTWKQKRGGNTMGGIDPDLPTAEVLDAAATTAEAEVATAAAEEEDVA